MTQRILKQRILFVCLGNICRSPAAEAVLQKFVDDRKLNANVKIDSAGTSGYHNGEQADARMQAHGQKRGYDLTSRSRQFIHNDFDRFDHIIVMDKSNHAEVVQQARSVADREKVQLFCQFCQSRPENEVPDPYFGGASGFELVYDILEDGCLGILNYLSEANSSSG